MGNLKNLFFVPYVILVLTFSNTVYSQASVYEMGIKFMNPVSAALIGEDGLIQQTTDGGVTWSVQNSNTTNVLYSTDFYDNSNGVVVGDNGMILVTNDGGNIWNNVESPVQTPLYSVKAVSNGNYVACGDAGVILRSEDNGRTWTQINSMTGSALYKTCFVDEFNGFIVGDAFSFLKSVDGGRSWSLGASGMNGYILNSISMIDINTGSKLAGVKFN